MNELVEKLLQPVSAEEPCGPDLSYDPAFDELATIAKGKPEVEMGEVKKPAEPPEWRELRTKSAEFLGRSKHLQVVMMQVCSQLTTEGVAGLRDGLQLVRGLLEKYWVELYPRLDPEDNNDPMQRLNILGALNAVGGPFSGWVTVIDNLYTAEICRSKGMPPLTFRQLLDAKAKVPGALDLPKLSAAIREVGNDLISAKRQALVEALEATQGIDQFLTTTLGAGGTISFEVLEKALQELIKELAPFCGDAGAAEEAGAEGGSGAEAGEAGGGGGFAVSGSIRSRDDVVRNLESICSYYAQVEPGSPVPLLLKRAQKLVKMNFIETMHELSLATLESLRPSMGSVVDSAAEPAAESAAETPPES
jgi:type VI secretion system protein ImpA